MKHDTIGLRCRICNTGDNRRTFTVRENMEQAEKDRERTLPIER